VFCPVYTEVEPCRDPTPRPILIFGVALEPVIVQLLDEYPDTFVSPEYGKCTFECLTSGHYFTFRYPGRCEQKQGGRRDSKRKNHQLYTSI